jgi:hypothetical protein
LERYLDQCQEKIANKDHKGIVCKLKEMGVPNMWQNEKNTTKLPTSCAESSQTQWIWYQSQNKSSHLFSNDRLTSTELNS